MTSCKQPRPCTKRDAKEALDAFAAVGADPSPRFVYLAVTIYADNATVPVAWPSRADIELKTGYSDGGVKKALSWLVEHGFLWRIQPRHTGKRWQSLRVPRPAPGRMLPAGSCAYAVIHGVADPKLAVWLTGPTLADMQGTVEECESLSRVRTVVQALAGQNLDAVRAEVLNRLVTYATTYSAPVARLVEHARRLIADASVDLEDSPALLSAIHSLDADALAAEAFAAAQKTPLPYVLQPTLAKSLRRLANGRRGG